MQQSEGTARGDSWAHVKHDPCIVSAAHELKSPLALVRQLALSLEMGGCSADEIAKVARQISLTSERALRLTTDLTKASRLEGSLFSLEPLNPLVLCEEVVEEISPLYQAKGREILVGSRSRPLLAIANRDLLRRVMIGFADNALHYTGDDTPVILTAKVFDGGSSIRLGVRDYGPAIPTQLWRKLSRSLGVAPQPVHNRPASSGLGIYIAQQFAEAMGGRVGASRHRDGATFYIDLSTSTQMRLL